jgi:hypothetical protein
MCPKLFFECVLSIAKIKALTCKPMPMNRKFKENPRVAISPHAIISPFQLKLHLFATFAVETSSITFDLFISLSHSKQHRFHHVQIMTTFAVTKKVGNVEFDLPLRKSFPGQI